MATVRAPSGHELDIVVTPDSNPLATHGQLYFGVNWVPAEVRRSRHRLWLRSLDQDALRILDREGPLPPAELTEELQSTKRFENRQLGTNVSTATVDQWLGYAVRRRLVDPEAGRTPQSWRITEDGRTLLHRLTTPSAVARGAPKTVTVLGGVLGIVATLFGGAEAVGRALDKEKDVLLPIAGVAASVILYALLFAWVVKRLNRARRRKRIAVLEVLRDAGRLPPLDLAGRPASGDDIDLRTSVTGPVPPRT